MTRNQFLAGAAVVVGATLSAFAVMPWATADTPSPYPSATEPAAPDDQRRTEAVIRLPSGTYAKQFAAEPYGTGKLTRTYDGNRVTTVIEAESQQFGMELELEIEAEIALSGSGTVFGVVNAVRMNRLKVNPAMLGSELPIQIGPDLYTFVEPLVNEAMLDLPFSYRCRIDGDRLTVTNFRALMTGLSPLGKLGAIAGDGNEALALLTYFQLAGSVMEGTYTKVTETPGQ